MRHVSMLLLLGLLAASPLSATEGSPAEAAGDGVVPSVVVNDAPVREAALRLDRVAVEQRAASEDAAAAQLGPRGGFWWMVGVIVVAGVILAVVL